ncbi:acetyl-CoA acetyltransferase with thiolase domain [Agrobacterium fabrum str. J-07]|uniref:acetyl-CoA C-acyltransferase n=1 Tax=Agrobacterium fabrum TaxID=1176649 RepID=UPI0009BAF1BC|nr:acetyl-CoA C-acyltransferase [Agrobacterium fabrum]CUX58331.1 acetyl-CoA acetyltransferase with thiolase domain [Agrobacterium fabrum str. J-07]
MSELQDPIVIVSAARTPMGGFQGELSNQTGAELGAAAISAALSFGGIDANIVDEVIMGCVLSAGQGQAPARQASIKAGVPIAAAASTINKMCGSGMKAAMLAHDLILAGSASVVVAGGMESMSNAPYLLPKARSGLRMGHGQLIDHMFLDGLEDAYEQGRLMGTFAEDCAEAYQFSREAQDAFAIESLTRAQAAIRDGHFDKEITAVDVVAGKIRRRVDTDEQPGKARLEKIPTLRPAFREGGTVTAANSSSISDGAAALVIMRQSEAERLGLSPRGRIVGHSTFSNRPERFATAPIGAMKKLSDRTGWSFDDVDLFEINEAFAVVPMAAMQTLGLPHDKVNVNGGACALGHPIGASGARILVTLLSALEEHGLTKGVASVCIGGGEATAIAIERIQ